jgi:phosphinothricin acetyltransferase
VDAAFRRRGIGTALVRHALEACPALSVKILMAYVLEWNSASLHLLRKTGFNEWGRLPGVADFDGVACGHVLMGRRVTDP